MQVRGKPPPNFPEIKMTFFQPNFPTQGPRMFTYNHLEKQNLFIWGREDLVESVNLE